MIGLGKLGLPCAEVMSSQHDVFGYDTHVIHSESITVKENIREALLDRDIIFIAVPTPHDQDYEGTLPLKGKTPKDFNYSFVKKVLLEIAKFANKKSDVVLISTVLPGTIQDKLLPLIEGFNFIYNPYLIAMGSVAHDFLNPELHIIGVEKAEHIKCLRLIDFYQSLGCTGKFQIGTWNEAECIKIFYNTFISFKISFVNMIQDIAMKLGDINAEFVTQSILLDKKRILSPMYMTPGMGDGGPCHPRDNIAVRILAEKLDLGYDLFGAVVDSRDKQAYNLANFLCSWKLPVHILGKSFKHGVDLTDGSYSLLVGHYIQQLGHKVTYWDPIIGSLTKESPGKKVYLIAHNNENLYNYPFEKECFIVDPWRKCHKIEGCEVIHYGNTRNT